MTQYHHHHHQIRRTKMRLFARIASCRSLVRVGLAGGAAALMLSALSFSAHPAAAYVLPTSTIIWGDPNPSDLSRLVTFTIEVGGGYGDQQPYGYVDVYVDGTFEETDELIGQPNTGYSEAQYSTYSLALGTHTVTAKYAGWNDPQGSWAPSSGSTTQTVRSRSTSISLDQSSTSSVTGQGVTLTAAVSVFDGGTPTGTVTFWDGNGQIGTAAVSGPNTAQLTIYSWSAGYSCGCYAVYNGDTSYDTSQSSTITHTVTQASTTTSMAASPNPANLGQAVTAIVTVAPVSPGSGYPTGSITIYDSTGNPVEGTTLTAADKDQVSVDISLDIGVGHNAFTVSYAGDSNYYGSSSPAAYDEVVNPAVTSTALSSSANPSTPGQSVTFTATITENPANATNPTGSVTFSDGSTVLGTATVTSAAGTGTATFTTSSLAAGSHSITAAYGGDTNDQSSMSNTVNQNVGSPTAAWVSAFHVSRQGSRVIFHWRLARTRGVTGLSLYAAAHKLNAHPIRVHAAPHYIFVAREAGKGRLSLHVLMTDGHEVVVRA